MGWLFGPKDYADSKVIESPVIGTVNVLEVMVGQRGTGKTTLECIRADELAREYGGAYVIGHSLGARLPTKLPDGQVLPITYHDSLEKLEKGLRKNPERWHILAPPINHPDRDTADDLLQFSVRLSDSIRKQAWTKAHPFGKRWRHNTNMDGIRATPIIVLIDEGIAIESAGSTKKDSNRWFYEYLFSIRHYHIAMFYSIQDPNARSWQLINQATEVNVFNMRHQWALQAIQAGGATPEEMEQIAQLPTPKQLQKGERKHEHVRLKLEGVVKEKPDWAKDPD